MFFFLSTLNHGLRKIFLEDSPPSSPSPSAFLSARKTLDHPLRLGRLLAASKLVLSRLRRRLVLHFNRNQKREFLWWFLPSLSPPCLPAAGFTRNFYLIPVPSAGASGAAKRVTSIKDKTWIVTSIHLCGLYLVFWWDVPKWDLMRHIHLSETYTAPQVSHLGVLSARRSLKA